MSWFKEKPDPKKLAKQNKREIKHAGRDIGKELRALERDEKKTEALIKKCFSSGDKASGRVHAKALVRIREQKSRMIKTQAQMNGMGLQMQAAASTHTLVGSMQIASKAAGAMNKQIDPAEMMATMNAFEKANTEMETKGEMMDDLFDGIFEDDGVDEEADDIIREITDGIALKGKSELDGIGLPSARPESEVTATLPSEDDLLRRLAAIKAD
mmetsp:Transcript_7528/g.19404  ORF Transcript_7528/g.19404 Transcript_7528/m.19404 type:complete len:213 (+) Transcript_7528:84-722(+)|eukprot:CAMPEP_0182926128 /NCGR_PEP_ID=MMETSP0105_2-20130417/10881_1 /TAXON_ID=81532 ORGANISM="Acanthoeca-like sp., Strain 10tr" /NCGR_SAMPLE_ID=MMETSP0105_2 /ASSEMBLY_ACC=CAM_ASM_000205 /LENGTH=212 /DNA_ID=CAMNT_0025064003 /DNA_START=81 /DNA_END=719 /DNA_ORIENTATION=-